MPLNRTKIALHLSQLCVAQTLLEFNRVDGNFVKQHGDWYKIWSGIGDLDSCDK